MRSLVWSLAVVAVCGSFAYSQVVINEIMFDPVASSDEYGEWFELYNLGTTDVDINGWIINCHGGLTHTINNGGPLLVPHTGFLVLGKSTDTLLNGNAPVAYAFGSDISLGGGDAIWLYDLSSVLQDSVNYGGLGFPDPNGLSMELYNCRMNNNVGSNWSMARTSWSGGDMGTPGAQNSVYSAIIPGELIVTEIMDNPLTVRDKDGEWFEVYNNTDADIDMAGLVIMDVGGEQFTVSGPFIVPARDFAVFTVNADPLTNGGVDFARMYDWGDNSTFKLSRGDKVIIRDNVLDVDSVSYDRDLGWPEPDGASMILTGFLDDNNDPLNWSIATVREPGFTGTTGDLGSPGTLGTGQSPLDGSSPRLLFARPSTLVSVDVNFSEALDPVSAEQTTNYFIDLDIGYPLSASLDGNDPSMVHLTVDTLAMELMYMMSVSGIQDLSGNVMVPDSTTFTFTPAAKPGDIVITEIMKNPHAVPDPDGEWFEVFNKTYGNIDMNGWTISDLSGQSVTVSGSIIVPARGLAIFTVNSDSATNGHMAVAYDSCGCPCSSLYDWGTHANFSLDNTDAIILREAGITIDSLKYDGTWPSPNVSSLKLKYFAFDNTVRANWDTATVREPGYMGTSGDLGSPGIVGTGQSTGSPFSITILVTGGQLPIPVEGDTLSIMLQVLNVIANQTFLEHWVNLVFPDGQVRPLVSTKMIMLRANGITKRRYSFRIPSTFPPGPYSIRVAMGAIGMYPSDTLAYAELNFDKLAYTKTDEEIPLFKVGSEVPVETFVSQNFPNPFNPSTVINYGLKEDAYVSLKVYNMIGQEVITLVNEYQQAGYKSVQWDGRNTSQRSVSSGIYIYRLTAGSFQETRRMLFLK